MGKEIVLIIIIVVVLVFITFIIPIRMRIKHTFNKNCSKELLF